MTYFLIAQCDALNRSDAHPTLSLPSSSAFRLSSASDPHFEDPAFFKAPLILSLHFKEFLPNPFFYFSHLRRLSSATDPLTHRIAVSQVRAGYMMVADL